MIASGNPVSHGTTSFVVNAYWDAAGSDKQDAGRFDVTRRKTDRFVSRVRILRDIAVTKPYPHDGSVLELKEAIQIMVDVQLGNRLAEDKAEAIKSFLKSLSGYDECSEGICSLHRGLQRRAVYIASFIGLASGCLFFGGNNGEC